MQGERKMSRKYLGVLFGLIVVLSLVLVSCGGSSSTESTGDAAAGETAFAATCARCHGDTAQGDIGPALAGFGESWSRFQNTVRNGEEEMPAFSTDEVSDQQLADIYAWLTQ
jgi:mono/diheme cytochrome c family protein